MRSSDSLDRLLDTMTVAVREISSLPLDGHHIRSASPDGVCALYIESGSVALAMPGRPVRRCQPETMALLPPGTRFELSNVDGHARVAIGNIDVRLCNAFGLLDQARSPLVERLSEGAVVGSAWRAMVAESDQPRAQVGKQALIDTLMKSCILTLLRKYVQRPGINLRIVRALVDPRLGSAVAAILDNPADAHSVESLATSAGLSRSTFARQFASELGYPPMEFVARTRLHHAASLLRTSRTPIKTIAAKIGFASRSHFSRAFRDAYGIDPQAFRQTALPTEAGQRSAA